MASCDMCGTNGYLLTTVIEGSQMRVCKGCSKYGTVVKSNRPPKARKKTVRQERPEIVLIDGAAQKIRELRENSGLTQKEFAEKIGERESVIPKIESGSMRINIRLAKRIEKAFKIKLTEEDKVGDFKQSTKKRASFTLGDFIKVKDKK